MLHENISDSLRSSVGKGTHEDGSDTEDDEVKDGSDTEDEEVKVWEIEVDVLCQCTFAEGSNLVGLFGVCRLTLEPWCYLVRLVDSGYD